MNCFVNYYHESENLHIYGWARMSTGSSRLTSGPPIDVQILEYKGKVCNLEHTFCYVVLCDISSKVQRVVGQVWCQELELITKSAVWFPALPVCVLMCPWALHPWIATWWLSECVLKGSSSLWWTGLVSCMAAPVISVWMGECWVF